MARPYIRECHLGRGGSASGVTRQSARMGRPYGARVGLYSSPAARAERDQNATAKVGAVWPYMGCMTIAWGRWGGESAIAKCICLSASGGPGVDPIGGRVQRIRPLLDSLTSLCQQHWMLKQLHIPCSRRGHLRGRAGDACGLLRGRSSCSGVYSCVALGLALCWLHCQVHAAIGRTGMEAAAVVTGYGSCPSALVEATARGDRQCSAAIACTC